MKQWIVLAAMALAALVACERPTKSELPAQVRSDLALLPATSEIVVYCNVAAVAKTEVAKEFLAHFETEMQKEVKAEEMWAFMEATGFDPKRDLQSVVAGIAKQEASNSEVHAIVRGQFDEQRLLAFVRNKAEEEHQEIPWREIQIGEHTLYSGGKHERAALAFLDAKTLVAGDSQWVADVLQGSIDRSTSLSDKQIAKLIKQLRHTEHFWVSVDLSAADTEMHGLARELRRNIPRSEEVKGAVFSAHFSDGVDFQGQIDCENNESAKLIADLAKGALAAVKLQAYKDRAAVDALNAISIEAHKDAVTLKGKLTSEFIKKLREQGFDVMGHRVPDSI